MRAISNLNGAFDSRLFANQLFSNSLLTVPRRLFCCGSMLPVFGVRVSVTFRRMCVHIILVLFRLLSGHLLEKAAHSVGHMTSLFSLYFDYL